MVGIRRGAAVKGRPHRRRRRRRECFVSWDARFRGYGRLAVRARIAWWVLEAWAARNHEGVLRTLRCPLLSPLPALAAAAGLAGCRLDGRLDVDWMVGWI